MANDPITGACDITSQTPATRPRPELEEHFESGSMGSSTAKQPGMTKENLKQKGREAANRVSAAVDQAGRQVKEQAGEATRRMKDQGATLLGQQKDRLASEIEHFGAAAHEAANKLDEENDCNVAHYLHAAADQIDGVAHYLRDSNVTRLVDDASHLARRRPEVFFGGMFIAGMALARFLKASGKHRHRMEAFGEFEDFDDENSVILEDFDEPEFEDESFGAGIGATGTLHDEEPGITTGVPGRTGTGAAGGTGSIGSAGSASAGSFGTTSGFSTPTESEKRHGDKLGEDRGPTCPPGSAGQEVV